MGWQAVDQAGADAVVQMQMQAEDTEKTDVVSKFKGHVLAESRPSQERSVFCFTQIFN